MEHFYSSLWLSNLFFIHLELFLFQVGFGKVSPINTIWVGMIGDLSEQQIERHFSRYGRVTKVVVNYHREQALVSFDSVESASIAQGEMKGRSMFGRRVKVRVASWRKTNGSILDQYWINIGSISVSGQLPTYPSPPLTQQQSIDDKLGLMLG